MTCCWPFVLVKKAKENRQKILNFAISGLVPAQHSAVCLLTNGYCLRCDLHLSMLKNGKNDEFRYVFRKFWSFTSHILNGSQITKIELVKLFMKSKQFLEMCEPAEYQAVMTDQCKLFIWKLVVDQGVQFDNTISIVCFISFNFSDCSDSPSRNCWK